MKYGESLFDIGYLIFAIVMGSLLLVRKEKGSKYMGAATLILGFGDAFHLVPRVLNYFVDADYTAALGLGKLITSITMTVFYIVVYRIWLYILLSFLFYIPVATAVSYIPMLGMLMLPKTVCYILIIGCFFRYDDRFKTAGNMPAQYEEYL